VRARRAQGWGVVALEQAARSVRLGSPECVLPPRMLLLLGAEKEGLPPELLRKGRFDELFFVDIKPGAGPPEVRFRGHGVALPLTAVAAPAPAAPLVATIAPPPSPSFVVACPDLRPAVPRFVVSLPSSSASPEEPA
jgi:hypothetical protein